MTHTDKQVLEAMVSIRNQHPKFVEWLQGRLDEHKARLVGLDSLAEIKIAQGRAQESTDIVRAIQQAGQN
jgi:hypothetical protein